MALTIKELATFCKKKGFIYPSSEIYGGIAGFWDFGPLGVELFNTLKQSWWKYFVHARDDIVGLDASIISHPKTWEASGHLESFGDLMLVCGKCKNKVRADHFVEERLSKPADGMTAEEINHLVRENKLKCPQCNSEFKEANNFNLLFETKVGASAESHNAAYLRGETAQSMFMNFKLVAETSRLQLPFGIAQVGRCFRNEISPRDFLFRSREFHIGEIEYFTDPSQKKCIFLTKKHLGIEINLLDEETQNKGKTTTKRIKIEEMIKKKMLTEWHAYFLTEQYLWLLSLGLNPKRLKIREHLKTELSHYSSATFDIDYEFPFGSKEIAGNANRGQFDLQQHAKFSKAKMEIFDETAKKKIIPAVIEPTFGMERVFLALLFDSYISDEKRGNVVLKLNKKLAPFYCAVFPLVKNKEQVVGKAKEVYKALKEAYHCYYDESGSVGRRYARADELGVPFCITIDFESAEDNSVTIRDRDSTKQERIKISELKDKLFSLYTS